MPRAVVKSVVVILNKSKEQKWLISKLGLVNWREKKVKLFTEFTHIITGLTGKVEVVVTNNKDHGCRLI